MKVDSEPIKNISKKELQIFSSYSSTLNTTSSSCSISWSSSSSVFFTFYVSLAAYPPANASSMAAWRTISSIFLLCHYSWIAASLTMKQARYYSFF